MAAKNIGHVLYGVWKKKYREHHGVDYVGSKYRDAGMLKGIVEDASEQQVRDAMDYYFERKSVHDLSQFIFNWNKLLEEKRRHDRDVQRREDIMEKTRLRMQEMGIELGSKTFDGDLPEQGHSEGP